MLRSTNLKVDKFNGSKSVLTCLVGMINVADWGFYLGIWQFSVFFFAGGN